MTDVDTKELETVELGDRALFPMLEYQYGEDAKVSCTPCLGAETVLPTLEVPYADRMQWEWEIHQRCRIDRVVVVAKTQHTFSVQSHPRKGDTLVFFLFAQDLDHGH